MLDLHTKPIKVVDTWRIKGVDLDLQSHQSNLVFIIIPLWNLYLVVSLKTLGVDLTVSARLCVVETLGVLGSLQLSCGVVPQALCKGSGFRLEGHRLVECELGLCGGAHRRIG